MDDWLNHQVRGSFGDGVEEVYRFSGADRTVGDYCPVLKPTFLELAFLFRVRQPGRIV